MLIMIEPRCVNFNGYEALKALIFVRVYHNSTKKDASWWFSGMSRKFPYLLVRGACSSHGTLTSRTPMVFVGSKGDPYMPTYDGNQPVT